MNMCSNYGIQFNLSIDIIVYFFVTVNTKYKTKQNQNRDAKTYIFNLICPICTESFEKIDL